jgi:peptidoglycan/xylan/chitin deacetylase (PgdA/CDA1 family)
MLRSLVRKGLRLADDLFVSLGPSTLPAGGGLVAVLFHSLYKSRDQLQDQVLAPNEGVTVEDFRRLVGALLDSGYQVVSPEQVDAGLEAGRNYAMLTFDDGYYNNTWALDVLEQFQVPATFFISSDHVLQDKAFWWDAFSRQLALCGLAQRAQNAEINAIKTLTSEGIEALLQQRFGKLVLQPQSDLDRPFTTAELKDFARSKWVHLGNHTRNHAILTNCSASDAAGQIRGCQQALADIAGYAPIAIAYPNGNYSKEVVACAAEAGLRIGFGVRPFRNPVPIQGDYERMTLGRFAFWGGEDARDQCRKFNSSFLPSNALKTLIGSRY